LAETITRETRSILGTRLRSKGGAKIETAPGMFGYDGRDRRKNPSNPMVRDWRRVLQNEWEADKLRRERRERHREEPRRDQPGGEDCIGGRDAGAVKPG
jgi:hypothetical protein